MLDRITPLFTASILLFAVASSGCSSDVQTGSTSSGGSGGEACSDYLSPKHPTWSPVTVRIKNSTAATLYLGSKGGCGLEPFSMQGPDGKPLTWQLEPCSQTCEAQQNGSCACAADCALPPVFLLPAGGAFDTTWKGSIFANASMPAACFKDPSCAPGGCLLEQAPPDGDLTVSATLWDAASGCGMGGMGACTCDPGMAGFCQLDGFAMVSGTSTTASAKLTTPGDKLVEIVFQ